MTAEQLSRQNRRLFFILLSLALIRGLIYIAIFPPWLAPDEPAHFEAIRMIGQMGVKPTLAVYDQTPMPPEMLEIFDNFRIWQEAARTPTITTKNSSPPFMPFSVYYPPISQGSVIAAENYSLVYHRLVSPVLALTRSFSMMQQVYFLRYVSLLLTLATVAMGWWFAATVFPGTAKYAAAVTAFLVFFPTHLHLNTSINTDVPATFTVSLFFLLLVNLFYRKKSVALWSGVILSLVVAILIKPTNLFVVPTFAAALTVMLFRYRRWPFSLRNVLLILFVVAMFFGAVILFQISTGGRAVISNGLGSLNNINLGVFAPGKKVLKVYSLAAQYGFISYWGLFGWANIHIPFLWVKGLAVVSVILVAGVGVFWLKNVFNGKILSENQQDILTVLLLAIVFSLIGIFTPIIATRSGVWGPPGRYFFPALLPTALAMFLGFQQVLPARLRRLALPAWVIGWIIYDTAVMWTVILPVVYG